jgi:hypothetical protein
VPVLLPHLAAGQDALLREGARQVLHRHHHEARGDLERLVAAHRHAVVAVGVLDELQVAQPQDG